MRESLSHFTCELSPIVGGAQAGPGGRQKGLELRLPGMEICSDLLTCLAGRKQAVYFLLHARCAGLGIGACRSLSQEVPIGDQAGSDGHSPWGAVLKGLPAGGAPSPVPGPRARLQPAPGTGPAAPPPGSLAASGAGRQREESVQPSAAHLHTHPVPAADAAAQPPTVSSVCVGSTGGTRCLVRLQWLQDWH